MNKQAQKVKYVATDIVAEEPETPSGGGDNGGGGGVVATLQANWKSKPFDALRPKRKE